ncbi:MAG: hypothetical protein ACKOWF_05830 [Chloroflexota bacterium]
MDDARFESLVRAVASRRSVGAGLIAAVAAGLGSAALPGRGRPAPALAQDCGADGQPCVPYGCCPGFVCSETAVCVPEGGGGGGEEICAYEGELCAKRPCCGDLICDQASTICVAGGGGGACAVEYEPCIDGVCCDGLVCGGDSICYALPAETPSCAVQYEACIDGVCCDGFVCGGDGLCYALATDTGACAAGWEPCIDGACCDGFVCGGDGLCYELTQDGGEGEADGGGRRCQAEGDSCENRDCCDGLTCSADLACVADVVETTQEVYCAFEGEYCQYLDCCDGLACSEDFACVPSTQASGGSRGGNGGNGGNGSNGSNGSATGEDTAPRPVRTPRPDRTATPAAPAPAPAATGRPNAAGTPAPARANRPNTFKGDPVFSTAIPAERLPRADAYALLAQVATVDPGITVDFSKEETAAFPGLAIDFVIDGVEQLVAGGEVQVYRSQTPGAAELVDAGQSVTLNAGDAAVRAIESGWKVSNTGTAPLRMLHVLLNENGAPTPPNGWNWTDFDFGSPVLEGPLGIMNLSVQRGTLDPGMSIGVAAEGSSQAVVQDLAARGARTSPLVPEPDGFRRNASSRAATVYAVALNPANG